MTRALPRVTASTAGALSLTVPGERITASTVTRTLAGPVVRYGVYGRTSRGRLRVAPGALRWPDDLSRVKLTREHNRDESRGHLIEVSETPDGVVRAALRVSDGPDGDAALREAADRTRDGFSFDVVDAVLDGDTITSALVIAIGQVGIPAYDDMRIDTIAASRPAQPTGATNVNPDQIARLADLRARRASLTAAELEELASLETLEAEAAAASTPAPAAGDPATPPAGSPAPTPAVTASLVSAVPAGVPAPARAQVRDRRSALDVFLSTVVGAVRSGGSAATITAALTDVISTDHTSNIEAPAWSGELWSGLEYVPEFTPLLASGPLTNWEGHGWRFVTKPEMTDYAGDKAAIGSGDVVTEPSTYEAARMAVGHDLDRKFYDFPNEGFLRAYVEAVRESWAIKLDAKVRAYIAANAVPSTRSASVTTTSGDATVTAAAGTFSAGDVGMTITGTGIPAAATIATVTNSGEIELSAVATASGTVTASIQVQKPTLLKAAAVAARAVKRSTRARATFVVVNDDDLEDLLDVAENDVPAFLDLFGIDPRNFVASPDVTAGTVLAGVRQAATVRTLPGSPIRVSAQHLANGGIDEAFFGYWAIEEHHESGIASVEYVPA